MTKKFPKIYGEWTGASAFQPALAKKSGSVTLVLGNYFFPGQELPRAYLVDTSEEALLIPDWLKLKMIRSSVSVLVDSALRYIAA